MADKGRRNINENNEINLNSEDDNYDPSLMELLENVNHSSEQNSTIEINEDDTDRANDVDQLTNDLIADCVHLGYNEEKTIDRASGEPADSSIDPSAGNTKSQAIVTAIPINSGVAQDRCSTETSNFDYRTTRPNNINSWHELVAILRERENTKLRFGLPRFLVLGNRNNDCFIISPLHLLINSPVFNQTIRSLGNVHSQFNTSDYGDLFDTLFNVVTSAHYAFQSEETDCGNFKFLRDRCHIIKPSFENGTQQDADEALLVFINAVEEIATSTNQNDLLTKFYITCSVSTDNGVPVLEHHHAIRIFDTNLTFKQLIDQHFIGTVLEQTEDGRTIQRTYQALPDQLLVICDRKQTGNAVHYSYPVEFTTRTALHYQFTGAIIHLGESTNSGHYITVVRRQDYVYILDDQHVAGGFHINYLTDHLEKVHVRNIIYTKVNLLHRFSFDDPLHNEHPDEFNNYVSTHFKKEKLAIFTGHDENKVSNFSSRMHIRHPIQSIFRYRYQVDYEKHNIGDPKLEDCLAQKFFHFSNYSLFCGSYAECTLTIKDPHGQHYYATSEIHRNDDKIKKFENPSYFLIDEKASVDNEWFSLELYVSKLIQRDALTYKDPKHGEIFHLKRFPYDTKLEITDEVLKSFEKPDKTRTKKKNKCSETVTFLRVTKTFNLRTLYLNIRLAKPNPNGNGFDTEPEILFCSNGFTGVDARYKVSEYEDSADKLKIIELTPSRTISFENTNKCVLKISYLIPEMYDCTCLQNKLIQIMLLFGDPTQKRSHPVYRMLDKKSLHDLFYYRPTSNSSTFPITITKRTMAEFQCDPNLLQTFGITPVEDVASIPQNALQNILNSPSMTSFHVQLQLCDFTNKTLTPYPRSIVVSDLIIEETISSKDYISVQLLETEREVLNGELAQYQRPTITPDVVTHESISSEEYTALPSSVNGNLIENIIDQSSLHTKRVFEKESNIRRYSPPSKHVKKK